jgi:hypothetical protein
LSGINFSPKNADEALESLQAVANRFLSMRPRHPLGYFPEVYGREMTARARREALQAPGSRGLFQGSEQANFVFIGKFASLYLKDLRAWLEGNEAQGAPEHARPRPEFAAWHLSFEYCQLNYEAGRSIPLLEAATGFIPHIVNDLGKAFALMQKDFREAGVPVDREALRMSHWNVAHLLDEASQSALKRFREVHGCPLSQTIYDLGAERAFPRLVLWTLMDLRIRAWDDFLLFDSSSPEVSRARLLALDTKATRLVQFMLALFGDHDPIRWGVALGGARVGAEVIDQISERSALGARYGMPPRTTAKTRPAAVAVAAPVEMAI